MNQLTHNLVDNEASDRNLTQQLSKAQDDIKQNNISTTQLLRNQSMELEMLRRQSGKDRSTIQQLNGSLTQEIRGIKEQIASKSNHHAFTAGIPVHNYGWTGDTLVFPVVIYSVGTGYNPSTGIFTAPAAGTYVFYVSVQSAWHNIIYLDIVMNGSSKVRAMAWYDSGSSIAIRQTGTNLVILHLQTGDRVWAKRSSGTGYHSDGAHITTFSGFKLY
uniref:C1q domain-containing protein n=1 Tax=Magallana gigas TaxID=29159 RepID=A0A8W8J9D1_MAGGI|nr:complement C1q-like protein 3 [Crassostrea gigas]